MHCNVINRVADAIERAELPLGFNMRDYLRRATPESPDHTGNSHAMTGDIAAWTCMLFTRDGVQRARVLSLSHLQNIVENLDMIAFVESAFAITEQQSLDLCAPGHWQERRDLRNQMVSKITGAAAVYALRKLAETGEVKWSPIARREICVDAGDS